MLAELDHFSFSPFPPPLGHIGWVRTKRAEKLKSYGTVVNVGTSFFCGLGIFALISHPCPWDPVWWQFLYFRWLSSKAALPVYNSFSPQTPTLDHRSRLFLVDATHFFVSNYLPVLLLQIFVGDLLVPATIFQFSFWIMKEVYTILITGQRPTCFAIWDAPWHLLHLRGEHLLHLRSSEL